jgi:hypothetical protein
LCRRTDGGSTSVIQGDRSIPSSPATTGQPRSCTKTVKKLVAEYQPKGAASPFSRCTSRRISPRAQLHDTDDSLDKDIRARFRINFPIFMMGHAICSVQMGFATYISSSMTSGASLQRSMITSESRWSRKRYAGGSRRSACKSQLAALSPRFTDAARSEISGGG